MSYRILAMRRKKSVLFFLLGITVLTCGWYIGSNYGNSSIYSDTKHLHNQDKVGRETNNVLISNGGQHPANSLKDVSIKSMNDGNSRVSHGGEEHGDPKFNDNLDKKEIIFDNKKKQNILNNQRNYQKLPRKT